MSEPRTTTTQAEAARKQAWGVNMGANLKEYRFRVVMSEIVTAYTEAEAREILEGSNPSADFHSVEVEEVRELARER